MAARQRIIPVRREYNRWVANQTLEDYALRFTAKSARRWSSSRVSRRPRSAPSPSWRWRRSAARSRCPTAPPTPSSPSSSPRILLLAHRPADQRAMPSRYGVDIDLLTRGAGFGYIGSTITSLIYASFTFILFAIEASIMSTALELCFGIPLWLGYIICAVVVIPLVTHGMRADQSSSSSSPSPSGSCSTSCRSSSSPCTDWEKFELWRAFAGLGHSDATGQAPFDLAEVRRRLRGHPGADAADRRAGRLPALPAAARAQRKLRHRSRSSSPAPAGSCSARRSCWPARSSPCWRCRHGVPAEQAADPAQMYLVAFGYMIPWHDARAAADGRLRGRLAAEDQRDERLCRLARLVELLLAADPQPSRPRRLAGLQRGDRAAADGARHLPGAGGDARPLLDRRRRLARRHRRPISSSTSRSACRRPASSSSAPISTTSIRSASAPWACRPRIALARPFRPVRRHRRSRSPPSSPWSSPSSPRRRSPGRPRASTTSPASRAHSWQNLTAHHLLDLRAPVRAGGHGLVPGLCRRRSARCAARSTRAATTCASRKARLQRPGRRRRRRHCCRNR